MSIKRSFLGVPIHLGTLLLAFFLLGGMDAYAVNPDVSDSEDAILAGQALFNANCKTCHKLDQRYTGPALRGVTERRELDWAVRFISNSQLVIESGDATAVALYREYNNIVMPPMDFLSTDEIMNLLSYIEYGDTAEAATEAAAAGEGAAAGGGGVPSEYLTIMLVVLVFVLLLILVVLGLIVSVLTKYMNSSDKLDDDDKAFINQKGSVKKLLTSDGFIVIVTTIVLALVVKTAIDGIYGVGIQQGYAPAQPIAYSHQLHAGQYEIQCQYCHTGVEIGKSANIPSANICMNCHMHIQNVGGQEGISPEIAKLYDAYDNNRPIEWVRVHNLPDLAYFNHSQHVVVGGIECQTCHGPIEEMEVVYQHSALTMGWCIDCHRNTEIVSQGNEYYDKLVLLHADSKDALKVKDIGGLECAKCHY
ncbi:MAG TPA: c-type cytochrome [Lunatimonas sp.]|nr:c-type cytochrome [Lunatimonas sp.]